MATVTVGAARWMVSAVPAPRHTVHLVRADAEYVFWTTWGYYYAVCGHQSIPATAQYRRELPVCGTCSTYAQRHNLLRHTSP